MSHMNSFIIYLQGKELNTKINTGGEPVKMRYGRPEEHIQMAGMSDGHAWYKMQWDTKLVVVGIAQTS